jgi:tellurite resistance protein
MAEPQSANSARPAQGTAAAAPATWLQRLPAGLFAIPLGLLGLAGAWARLTPLAGDAARTAEAVGLTLTTLGGAIWLVLFALWLLKALRHAPLLAHTWRHPVQGSLLALWPVSTLLVVAVFGPRLPADAQTIALALLLAALLGQLAIAWQVVFKLTTGRIPAEQVTPALYLPPVAGGFVGALALQALGLHGWAVLLFGMALGGWALLEARILHRLFAGPLPLALRPTLGLEMAPTSVGALTLAVLWPQLPPDVLLVALGIATGPVLAVLSRWHWWTETPFSVAFWSFSFPVAAFAATVVEAVRRGGWSPLVAWLAVGAASAVIGFLALRTLALARAGRLLPSA